ncbi:phosphoribosyltransferase [Hassallia byssoidea VB512170]|uniref:Phosphoribosyltransferase n=1 Tax=Hassallia byssoidea VB512170 TaxID=1304833 RepID=A0A846H4J1_9CYAN|nr:phosphoribosyltransferase [Hassalia byssoidea]NEU71519.1 phosphoribosyltransferase [Hassalia byssoidea VB512170]
MLFKDRTAAGKLLAGKLVAYANRADVLVLALPRGGVPVAFEVAKALNAALDVFVVRKLGVPGQKELAMGAIASGNVRILLEDIIRQEKIDTEAIEKVTQKEQQELNRRQTVYRGDRPKLAIAGRTIILIDDGLATGATMRAAIAALHKQQPAKIVVAVPVSSPQTYQEIKSLVDEIICADTPTPFYCVGLWYEKFPQTTDQEVRYLLNKAANP